MHRFHAAQRQCDTGESLARASTARLLLLFAHATGPRMPGMKRAEASANLMSRRARLTVLELGASPSAWASHGGQGADDCIVVAQQCDETGPQFTERVQQRARRLCREDAHIESVDVYAAPRHDAPSSAERRSVIEALAQQMATGSQLTLWSTTQDTECDAELAATLAQFAELLAERQIAVNHQTCEPEMRSGVRHAIPTNPNSVPTELSYEDLG